MFKNLNHILGTQTGATKFTCCRTYIQAFMVKISPKNSKHIKHGKKIKSSI